MNEMTQVNDKITAFREATGVPGYLIGVYHGGQRTVLAQGTANLATAAPMRDDTGFLFGSITKVMTTMLVLQQVDRGLLELDAPVVRYLPEFRLATPGADRILIRHLVTHTSGIDADLYFPVAEGPGALEAYVDGLGRRCGALFEPGTLVSYSNGGMMIAGRLLEAVTGLPYHELLEREMFQGVGMHGSATSARQAILRSTAIGHFADPATGQVSPTGMFMLPDTWAPAGGTPIGTIDDLLALGRTHLHGGVAPSGTRVMSPEAAALMRTVSHDMGTPNVPPVGMGWLLTPYGGTTVLSMSGASPGGVAVLAVAPELDLVVAAYGNDPRALALHDELLPWLVRELSATPEPPAPPLAPARVDLARYAGTYRSDQLRVEVRVVDGGLEERITYEPADATQEQVFTGFVGGPFEVPPLRYEPVGDGLFAPAGLPLETLDGYARQLLVSYHGDGGDGPTHRCAGGRMTRRVWPTTL
ncbi:serine hydrolase domain-containing protein [Catellatospora sp. NPDC049133]|uniref:serine hydrolase domain-containing protein n=1 Tax=Catellatospora sp. NPDC049133 TaxID=3155499 RepID=UPI0033E4FEF0